MLGRIRSTRRALNVYQTLRQRCCYATAASEDPVDHHKRLGLHEWPTSSNPTAYEIFGLSSKDMGMSPLELNKILKKRYVSLVKIYHPDTSLVLKHKGKEIDTDLKRKRFDMIQESYQILKNPRRRIAYNRFQTTTWEQQGMYRGHDKGPWSKENFEAHRRANAHRRRYDFKHDEEFWHAATWQDYYQMKYKRAPPTQEELDKNKYKILAGVLLFGAVGFGLQMINAVDNANKYLLETQQLNLKSMKALNDSYDNYGQGHSEADKRSECRYGDEDISGDGGLEANLCRSELGADPGVLNSDDDYDTIDIDISCHQDIWSHSGVYAQIYDKNHLGTILSATIAPYTNDKKGTLNKMPMCSNGLKHQCGRV
ncbi:J domain-containing protein 1 [Candida tropicalis]